MQPEDIDKLFRDRLEGHAPTPPAYLWNQLEAELQPTKKRPVLWLWAAAAVALLLVSGLLWLQLAPAPGTVPLATRPAGQVPQPAALPEKKSVATATTQATPPQAPASSPSEAVSAATPSAQPHQSARMLAPNRPLMAASSSRTSQTLRTASVTPPAPMPASSVITTTTQKAQPERLSLVADVMPAPQTPAVTAVAVPTGPIEVEVHRSSEAATVAAAGVESSSRRSLGGILLRQARNAVRGDRVSLAETGLPETVTVEAHVAGRTLTKVIQL